MQSNASTSLHGQFRCYVVVESVPWETPDSWVQQLRPHAHHATAETVTECIRRWVQMSDEWTVLTKRPLKRFQRKPTRPTRFATWAKGTVQKHIVILCTVYVLFVRTLAVCKTQVPTPEDPAWTKTLLPGLIFQSDMACRFSSALHVVAIISYIRKTYKHANKSSDTHVHQHIAWHMGTLHVL